MRDLFLLNTFLFLFFFYQLAGYIIQRYSTRDSYDSDEQPDFLRTILEGLINVDLRESRPIWSWTRLRHVSRCARQRPDARRRTAVSARKRQFNPPSSFKYPRDAIVTIICFDIKPDPRYILCSSRIEPIIMLMKTYASRVLSPLHKLI